MSKAVVAASNKFSAHAHTDVDAAARAHARPVAPRVRRFAALRSRTERGAATAEYAISIVAACGFGGILVALLKSDVMMNALKALINYALKLAGVDGIQL